MGSILVTYHQHSSIVLEYKQNRKEVLIMEFKHTDPELDAIFTQFADVEVPETKGANVNPEDRYLAILAALLGSQSKDLFKPVLKEALEKKAVSAVEVREVVYQAVDYLGTGRVYPFVFAMNEVFESLNIELPLENQATVTSENRLEKGYETQAAIFGPQMREAWKASDINRWLADNCFGDFYTRTGLELAKREMVTFCYLMAQGGCEPQMVAHAKGNFAMGNTADFLIRVAEQCVPYVGYPRVLNGIAAIKKAAEPQK